MFSIFTITLAFVLGIAWGLYLEFSILVIALIFLCILMLTLILNNYKLIKLELKNILIQEIFLFIVFLISTNYCKYKVYTFDNKFKEDTLSGIFTIISYNQETKYYNKYTIKDTDGNKFIAYFKKSEENFNYQIGYILSLNGSFELPDISRNFGSFNYRRSLNSDGIYGNIKVLDYYVVSSSTTNLIYTIQNKIHNTFKNNLSGDFLGIMDGIFIGEKTYISDETNTYFRESGISHLLAVSGTHILYVISIFSFIFNKTIGKKYSSYFIILFIILYIFISGCSPSVIRAGIMAISTIIASIINRKSNSINNLSFSALFILVLNPLALINLGFVLSFVGTIGIISMNQKISNYILGIIKSKKISDILGVTLSAQISLLPIMVYYFHTISFSSLITNFLIVPIWGIVMILGFILLFISIFSSKLAILPTFLITCILKIIIFITKIISNIKFLNLNVIRVDILTCLLYYLTLFSIFSNKSFFKINKKKIITTIVIAFFVVNIFHNLPKNYIQISAIDVGQGDAFLIRTEKNKNILIDCGGSKNVDYDVGENILVPYLLNNRISNIDLIFISHAHEDHINGIFSVIDTLKVNCVILGGYDKDSELISRLVKQCKEKNVKILKAYKGDMISIDNVNFQIIFPDNNYKNDNLNNLSMVIKMLYSGRSMLFTGDIEAEAEKEIINTYSKDFLNIDILKVAHHGGKTSSIGELLEATTPEISVISVAKKNSYRTS